MLSGNVFFDLRADRQHTTTASRTQCSGPVFNVLFSQPRSGVNFCLPTKIPKPKLTNDFRRRVPPDQRASPGLTPTFREDVFMGSGRTQVRWASVQVLAEVSGPGQWHRDRSVV